MLPELMALMSERIEWAQRTLAEVGEIIRGRRFTKNDYVEAGLGCIHYGQIYTDYGVSATRTVSYLPESFRDSMRLAQPGDVVIAGTSENRADVGKAVAWLGCDGVAVHDDCFIFRHSLNPSYVSYFFASSLFGVQKMKYLSETKVVRISGASLNLIEIPVPPASVQQQIVTVLNAVDDQVAALEIEANRLLQVRDAAVGDVLSRGGEGWLSVPLSEVGTFVRGRRFVKSDYVASGLGCIHYGQIYTEYGVAATHTVSYLPESFRDSMRLAQPGDVVVAGTSENIEDVGKAVAWLGVGDVAVHDDCFIFRHDLDPKFVAYFFASPLFQDRKRRFTSETKVVRISAAGLAMIVIPVPPRVEQERISDMADAVNDQVIALRVEADRLRQARVTLLSRLLDRTIDITSAESKG